jgi:hypothetical protein
MRTHTRALASLLLGVALGGLPSVAEARTLDTLPYPITSVWPAAVRFLRVDRGFPVREKDEESGYILFEWTDSPKPCKGSVEVIRVTDREGRDATRVAITIPDLPKRYEQMLIDKLFTRLKDDIGPPPPPPRKPDPPKPDAGTPPPTPPALPPHLQLPVNPAQ